MKKIAIVCDSSVSFTPQEIEDFNVTVLPLTIIHNNIAYLDQITITERDVISYLSKHERVTTSQPSVGLIYECFEKLSKEDYDHIFCLSIGTALSGTYPSMCSVQHDLGIKNMTVINTYSITGPVQQGVRAIRLMNERNESIEDITQFLNEFYKNQVSYIYPETLDQVIASGRVSKTSATIANMLKIKPILYLANQAESIEKLAIARSERKAFKHLIDDLNKHNVDAATHDIYLLHCNGLETLNRLKDSILSVFGSITCYTVNLPAAVSTHAGIGTISLQWCLKIDN